MHNRKSRNINNGSYDYMHQTLEIVSGEKGADFQMGSLSGGVFKSFFFPDFYYLEKINKYLLIEKEGVKIIEDNGTPVFYKKIEDKLLHSLH
ncbi:hypothetical protein [uncultured Chryseobacterium sp.]|uniref:hypothetical protein n=1 Tax=uncultured Chryseobacterium sp. TaxID=259322 RepID=UPI0027DDAD8B|nr:hypothetical protein [uncultured Chryseobacterium sp.]